MEEKLLIFNIVSILMLVLSLLITTIESDDAKFFLAAVAYSAVVVTLFLNLFHLVEITDLKDTKNFAYKDNIVQVKDTLVVTNKKDTIKLKELKPVEIK